MVERMTENGNRTNGTIAGNRIEMDRFLAKMRDSGNVRLSCIAADVNRSTVYRWRNKWTTFADEWDEALEEACDILEGKAWDRAVNKGSDRLLMFLLKAYRSDRFKERSEIKHEGGVEVELGKRFFTAVNRAYNGNDSDTAATE